MDIRNFEFDASKTFNVTSSILQDISTQLPNLIDLDFQIWLGNGDQMVFQRKFERDVMHLLG